MADDGVDPRLQRQSAGLPSPRLAIERVGDGKEVNISSRPPVAPIVSEPPISPSFSSPARQHKRTPSAHREIKETLDARVEFTSDESDGRTYHRINQYVIKEEIGRGSYGAVHRATDQYGNEFAVKEFSKTRLRKRAQSHILRLGPPSSPQQVLAAQGRAGARLSPQLTGLRAGEKNDALFFIREEIAIMKKLNHPNLVQLIEVLDDPEEDSLYMVMEMCRKGVIMNVGLDESAEPYDEESCRHWFRDLLLGIEYLHAQGVIHRDIKPDNLLLSVDEVLKIVDFGVSEMFDKLDTMRTSKSAGSPAFMPPELCGRHQEISGKAADIWSMGVTLYCLRYGRIPFNRPGVLEIYTAIKEDEAAMPPDEDPMFVDLMRKLLEKDPEKRITMSDLRGHPWVTKDGADPLLSSEDNCENMVEPPNELELSRAFTRKMNHLLFVMKVIQKFRMILASIRERRGTKSTSTPDQYRPASTDDSSVEALEEKSKAEVIESVLARRRELLERQDQDANISLTHVIGDQEPLLLGIGTGARDAFIRDEDTPDIVADSPTAVDFNVYDRAYEEAIKRRMEAKPSKRPTMYLTKFVKETEYFRKMENLTEGMGLSTPVLKTELKEAAQALKDNVSASRSAASSSALKTEFKDAAEALKENVSNSAAGKLIDVVNKLGMSTTEDEAKSGSHHAAQHTK